MPDQATTLRSLAAAASQIEPLVNTMGEDVYCQFLVDEYFRLP